MVTLRFGRDLPTCGFEILMSAVIDRALDDVAFMEKAITEAQKGSAAKGRIYWGRDALTFFYSKRKSYVEHRREVFEGAGADISTVRRYLEEKFPRSVAEYFR